MPQLGETVVEGTITAWVAIVGDRVAIDDTLFEVSTEKVDTEVPSAVAGYLRAVLVEEGEAVPIGTPVAVITATADEPFDAGSPPARAGPPPDTVVLQAGLGELAPHPSELAPRPDLDGPAASPTSPVVRRLLAEHGLDPSDVVGSGRDGRITRNDVVAAAAQRSRPSAAAPSAIAPAATAPRLAVGPDDDVVELSRARAATADNLRRSVDAAVHALVVVQVDWTAVDRARRAAGTSYLPFAAAAAVDALRAHPRLNASFDVDRLVVHRRVHLGIAVDAGEALLVPVVHDAQDLRLGALADAIAEVADLARRRRLPGDAFDGGTFTLTNIGSYGTVTAAPIINLPQVAILSTDGVRMTPIAVSTDDGTVGAERTWGIAVRPVGNLSLSFDHRAVDGAEAAAFLARVRDTLQDRDWHADVEP